LAISGPPRNTRRNRQLHEVIRTNGLLNEDGTAAGRAQTAFTLNGRDTYADGSMFGFHQNGNTVFDAKSAAKVEVFHERPNYR
jgi:hypothetical protein